MPVTMKTDMTFTSIDFETANNERTSACQIGIVIVENGEMTKEFSSYIKPEPNYFIHSDIHGIDETIVAKAPTFPQLWKTISDFIEKAPLIVAHNASFDMSVLKRCLEYHEIKATLPQHYCTYRNVKKRHPNLENHQLSTVCEHFGISLNHHEALSDARGAAKIALELGLK